MRRPSSLALALCAVLAGPTASVGRADTSTPSTTVTYAASSEAFPNPERGFLHYTATHFHGTSVGDAPLDETRLREWRTRENITLASRVFYLEGHTNGPLPDAVLRSVEADLTTARRAGIKLVVRFAYSEDTDADAPPTVVVGHVRQLAPVLNRNADVVAHLQAGFVGRWGEWYYSRHFVHDPSRPWDLTDADRAARRSVLDALLAQVSSEIPVQVRYMATLRDAVSPTVLASGRIGLHDDCFLASDTDHGTYQDDDERRRLLELSTRGPVGGETCAPNGVRTAWPTARAELAAFHWTYLNADYHPDVLGGWGSAGRDEVARRLGPRLRLVSTTVPTRVLRGSAMDIRVAATNDGYAAPVENRPVHVVFRRGDVVHRVPVAVDLRALTPGRVQEATVRVTAPPTPGTWQVGLWLPDRAARLRTNPAYSLRLANVGTWDAATGINVLPASVEVR